VTTYEGSDRLGSDRKAPTDGEYFIRQGSFEFLCPSIRGKIIIEVPSGAQSFVLRV